MTDKDDLPWLTDVDEQRQADERNDLHDNQYNDKNNEFGDVNWSFFRIQVLDRYTKHQYCSLNIPHGNLRFLDYDKKTSVSTVFFDLRDARTLVMQVRNYADIPPKERQHWERFRISNEVDLEWQS